MKQEKKQKRVQPTSRKIEESLSYSVEVRDKQGRVIQRISAPSRSYVQQWNQIINIQASQANKTVTDIAGNPISIPKHSASLRADALLILMSIVVGKGTTAVAITDYALESLLEYGTGTDELSYQPETFTEPSVVGSTCSFTLRRVMVNNSGATITGIKEIGCYNGHGGVGVGMILGFRDVLPSAVSVPHGGSITVTYTIKVTV